LFGEISEAEECFNNYPHVLNLVEGLMVPHLYSWGEREVSLLHRPTAKDLNM
jgi:hypothetical protein